jgi:hypothetical protein
MKMIRLLVQSQMIHGVLRIDLAFLYSSVYCTVCSVYQLPKCSYTTVLHLSSFQWSSF